MSQTNFIPSVSCFQSSPIILVVLDMMETFLGLVSDFPNGSLQQCCLVSSKCI